MSVQSAARANARNGAVQGIAWMLLTGLLFVSVTGIVRHLGSDMNAAQAAFVRYFFGLVMLVPVFVRQRPAAGIYSRRIGLHALRGVVHGLAVMLWFYAMARIPIAQVTALGFTAPLFTAVGAALFLGERIQARRLGAILCGFAGALVILRPGFVAVDVGALAQLTAAPLFATSFLIAKKLTETEPSATIVAYLAVFVTLALMPPALFAWRAPSGLELMWLATTAVFATLGHYTLTRAFQATAITLTQPFSFLQLVWATVLGYVAFGEEPDGWTWLGGAMIVGSATYIAYRESRRRAPAATPPKGDEI